MKAPELICPVCREPLQAVDNSLCCSNRHSFDRARQGYWNLLLAQKKRSKTPGDNAEMVQARQRFLEAGHYAPLCEAIGTLLQTHLSTANHANLLDLGCGEGWYTDRLQKQMDSRMTGLDISKDAVKAACRRNRDVTWLVATGADIPMADASVDAATLIFSRLMPEPTARVLKPGGLLLVVHPGPDHLLALRRLIYSEVRASSGFDPATQLAEWFDPVVEQSLGFEFSLDTPDAIQDLLAMTPHGQRLNADARTRIAACNALQEQADFRLCLFRKRASSE
ncbi:putative RNA methyltransferase [Marinobacterium sediminicola]|uniref:Predicted 23S rRNA m(1)G methyltransferase n=1 Tax=Marinobacterium sediminicola TaxID=518898 RepID=A0ABY1S1E6_9GAMM|nr:methyltransferase domain-containing protein [Marinobacterium sediminicola]ULG69793.1 methyltransferase domain-containing protein [Marinobacterium sediminicola]SMR75393.1 predicted 23S rRNA m(1)G methyltransferase [Marinobacterium sediminicola]